MGCLCLQFLPLTLQVNVLKACWMEIVIVTVASRPQPDSDSVYLTPSLMLSCKEAPGDDHELQRLVSRLINECVFPLRSLDLSDKETACLRGLILFCPGTVLSGSALVFALA